MRARPKCIHCNNDAVLGRHRLRRRCEQCNVKCERAKHACQEKGFQYLREFVAAIRLHGRGDLPGVVTRFSFLYEFRGVTYESGPLLYRSVRWRENGVTQTWKPRKTCKSHPYFEYLYMYDTIMHSFWQPHSICEISRSQMIALLALRRRKCVPVLTNNAIDVYRIIFRHLRSIY